MVAVDLAGARVAESPAAGVDPRRTYALAPMNAQPPANSSIFRRLLDAAGWPVLLVIFIPIAVILQYGGAGSTAIFITAALGVIPTAALMGRATEELAARSGPGIGGLLNVTFGNAPELIIALVALVPSTLQRGNAGWPLQRPVRSRDAGASAMRAGRTGVAICS